MPLPALRNLGRMMGRQVNRLRLVFERRKLVRLETALGLLGWQQADYDVGTQQHADRVTDFEREQARLTNQSAEFGLQIVEIDERRGALACEYADALKATLEKEHPSAASLEELDSQYAAKRKECREMETQLAAMDEELAAAEERYRSLVSSEMPSPQIQSEMQRLRNVILAHPRQKADRAAKFQQATNETPAMKTLLEALVAKCKDFEKRDQELDDEVADLQRKKRKVEKQVDALEKSKSDPYREIGRALADQKIEPLNQPEALTAVLEQRKKIVGLEAAIAASLAASAAEGQGTGLKCWLMICGMIGSEMSALLAIGGQ
jgi:hypothetical protein